MTLKKREFLIRGNYGWTNDSPRKFGMAAMLAAENILLINAITPITHIACSGTSGTSMSFILSVMLDIPVIYVRKKGEKSHGQRIECNGRNFIKSYLIVDDFVDTGSTVDYIINRIAEVAEDDKAIIPKCAGVYLYDTTGSSGHQTEQGRIPIYGSNSNYYKFGD